MQISKDGEIKIVPDLELSEYSKDMLKNSCQELKSEAQLALQLAEEDED